MSVGGDDFFGTPEDEEDHANNDEDFFGPEDTDPAPRRNVGRVGRPRRPWEAGSFGAWLVAVTPTDDPSRPLREVAGLGRVNWIYKPRVAEAGPTVARGPGAGACSRTPGSFGDIEYVLETVHELVEGQELPETLDLWSVGATIRIAHMCSGAALRDSPLTVSQFTAQFDLPVSRAIPMPGPSMADWLMALVPRLLYRVPIKARMRWQDLVFDYPPMSAIKRWRRESRVGALPPERAAPSAGESGGPDLRSPLLELPPKYCDRGTAANPEPITSGSRIKSRLTPSKMLDAIDFSLKLREVREFGTALDCANQFNYKGPDDIAPPRDKSMDPSRSGIERSKARLDAVGLLIERRIWAQEVADDCVEAINVFSDASPVVGAEIQGMIVDIVKSDGHIRKVTLPGATLHYGRLDVINKTMAFVWAVWLCFGPLLPTMVYFFNHVRSFTTDFGGEMKTIEMPWVLYAFMAWVDGRPLQDCASMIDMTRRQFPAAIRISGWNHACGNLMKDLAKRWPLWPQTLEHLRSLCRFFRVETWRQHLVQLLRDRIPGLEKLLKTFTANIAKWRFETMVAVTRALRPLRRLCQEYIREELFSNFQDRHLLQEVVNACRDFRVWQFICLVGTFIFDPCEHIRRWGMSCDCCEEKRKRGEKFLHCPKASRRLAGAWTFIQIQISDFKQKAVDLTPAMCEGSNYMCGILQSLLRTAADLLFQRWKYLNVVPWAFATADTVEGAAHCMRQVRAKPLAEHDPATRDIVGRLEADLLARAAGGPCSDALKAEVKRIRHTPFDESCGEGYHRTTNHEKVRAPSATVAHLKRQTRVKGVVKTVRSFKAKHGQRGIAIFDYEWHHFTRLLQTRHNHRWRVRRIKPHMFYKKDFQAGRQSRRGLVDHHITRSLGATGGNGRRQHSCQSREGVHPGHVRGS